MVCRWKTEVDGVTGLESIGGGRKMGAKMFEMW